MEQELRAIPRQRPAGLDHFFLDQLRVLIARQRAARTRSERVALAQATFAVFLDCHDLGLTGQAQALMQDLCRQPACRDAVGESSCPARGAFSGRRSPLSR